MTAESVGVHPPRPLHRKPQRRLVGPAPGSGGKDARADAAADHRQAAVEEVLGQAQFGGETGYEVAADDAIGTDAEQDETIVFVRSERHRPARRERPAVAEADIAALEMVLHQAEIVGFDVLEDAQGLHGNAQSVCVRAFINDTSRRPPKHI